MSILDSTRRSWYSSPMIFAALLVAFVFGVNHSIRRRPRTTTVLMGRYSCDTCENVYLLPFDPKGPPCPTCTPVFQRLEEIIKWTP